MSVKWISTPFKGVRFYKHPKRKHGVKYDQYFAIRYQKDQERKEEGCGWASEGWTAEKAALLLEDLRKTAMKGEPGARLAERREKRRRIEDAEARDQTTLAAFWTDFYLSQAESDKNRETVVHERSCFKKWISPSIGALPLKSISPIHLEKLKSEMNKAKLSPRSVQYTLQIVRQIFNEAKRRGVFVGENPVSRVKIPKIDNRRLRFLTHEEADALLAELLKSDREAWEMALLSLHCGLRAGEIFKLTWADIDAGHRLIAIKDPKSGRSRFAHMTGDIKDMLLSKEIGKPSALLYPGPGGALRREVPRSIKEAIDSLGFNKGREDRRDKVVFHSLRHTFASWLVQNGVDLYTVKELLGHSSLAMTERYSHLAQDNLKNAVKKLEGSLKTQSNSKVIEMQSDK